MLCKYAHVSTILNHDTIRHVLLSNNSDIVGETIHSFCIAESKFVGFFDIYIIIFSNIASSPVWFTSVHSNLYS